MIQRIYPIMPIGKEKAKIKTIEKGKKEKQGQSQFSHLLKEALEEVQMGQSSYEPNSMKG